MARGTRSAGIGSGLPVEEARVGTATGMGVDEHGGRTITTRVPARLDRLPWSRWHWTIVIGLGTVWILDG
ncbi:hypothetical protein ACFV2H_50505, partial [Streptomyces sp. NPDC059629]|uniref:hypothetical protein n=1 Tax=Streptomyces sp. NPDC059629 TaxID=3346889 RepID=UPI00369936D3